jgi:hypothetical protein
MRRMLCVSLPQFRNDTREDHHTLTGMRTILNGTNSFKKALSRFLSLAVWT